ncbi:uncharacterized protein LOC123698195 [Colias croceus]|uniref:uncharacterized protein LOC123698195 n=1 Tax=Colias crocea TaxID=72248 RepID=UPI001E27B3BC|nr:uncharacterized protein LOC123698195 [Colias croceus]
MSRDITFTVLDDPRNLTFMYAELEVDEITCNVTRLVRFRVVNRCARGCLRNGESIFPKKVLRDFKKCPLNSGFATLHPYMSLNKKNKNYTDFDPLTDSDISGADVELIKIASQYFNTTLRLYFIYRQEENPFVDKQFLDLLQNGSLDICAGGLYRIYDDIVDYSGVYTRQAVVWVYSVEREIRSWQSFVGKLKGIYVFFVFYFIYAIVWKLMCIIDNQTISLNDTLLYSAGALLGTTSLQDARSLKQKIVNVVYLIMALHLSAYIGVQLYSYLTIQGPPTLYRTIDELISSGVKPYLMFTAKYFLEDKKYESFANTSGSCGHFIDCEDVILKKKGTTILIDGFLPPYQADTAVGDEARVVRVNEDILFIYHEMIIRKNSYFTAPFQKMVMHLFEAGICQKLYFDAIGITYVDKADIANKNIMSNSYSCQVGCAITLSQTAGAFYIWIFGCAVSSIVLILEIFMRREKIQIIE